MSSLFGRVSVWRKKENLTDGSLSTYVTYIGGVDLAENIPITCIHLDKTQELKKILDSGKNIRTGFIVQTEAGLLNADVLSFFESDYLRTGKRLMEVLQLEMIWLPPVW